MRNLLKKKVLLPLAAVILLVWMPLTVQAGSIQEAKALIVAEDSAGNLIQIANGFSFILEEGGSPRYSNEFVYVMTSYNEALEDASRIMVINNSGGTLGEVVYLDSNRNAGITILLYKDISDVYPDYVYPMNVVDSLQQYQEDDNIYISGFDWRAAYEIAADNGLPVGEMLVMAMEKSFHMEEQISDIEEVAGYTVYELESSYGDVVFGSPLVNSGGFLAGIAVREEGGCEVLSIDGIVDALYVVHVTESYFLIPMAILALAAAISAIAYFAKVSQRNSQGLDEFDIEMNVKPDGYLPGVQGMVSGKGGTFDGQSFSLDKSLVFGRDNTRCNVVYPGETRGISSVHCSLEKQAGKVYLTDLGSTYGTFLGDGTKLAANVKHELKSGDTFYLAVPLHTYEIR